MLAATAGDTHGFRVGVLSLSLSFLFGRAHELITQFNRSHLSRGWNKPQYVTHELTYFFR